MPDVFDIDHTFFWKGVLAWGGEYVRVLVLPWDINSAWGWTYEATILDSLPNRVKIRMPMIWQTIAKTLCAPVPFPNQVYDTWLEDLSTWMAELALWPYNTLNTSNNSQLQKMNLWINPYHRFLFDRGLRWNQLAETVTVREGPNEE